MQLEIGQVVAERYEVLGRVGADVNGEVYRVRDQEEDEVRALKVIHDAAARSPVLLETFRRQVRVARKLDHPNLIKVYELGDFQGSPILVTEFVEGESLTAYFAKNGPVNADSLLPIAGQICAALDFLHQQNIIHRDVKPGAFIFGPDGSLKLRDFGMAREVEGQQTIALPGAASAHLSPEQLLGRRLDARSDIYSAGRIFFELLAGRPPHADVDVITRYTQPPPLVTEFAPETPPHVAKAIDRCLQPEIERRFASMAEVSEALKGPQGWGESAGQPAAKTAQPSGEKSAAPATPDPPAAPPQPTPRPDTRSGSDQASRSDGPPRPGAKAEPGRKVQTSGTPPPASQPTTPRQPPPADHRTPTPKPTSPPTPTPPAPRSRNESADSGTSSESRHRGSPKQPPSAPPQGIVAGATNPSSPQEPAASAPRTSSERAHSERAASAQDRKASPKTPPPIEPSAPSKPDAPSARERTPRAESKTLRLKISGEPGKARDVVAMLLDITHRLNEMAEAGEYHAPLSPGVIRLRDSGVVVDSAPPPEPGKTLVVNESKYLAPECLFSRPVEPKAVALSDVYSLGFIAYEWLLGEDKFAQQFPFDNMAPDNFEWMRWHGDRTATVAAPAEVCNWIPAALSRLVESMISKDAAGRPESYGKLIEELEAIRHRIEDTDHIAGVRSIEGLGNLSRPAGRGFAWQSMLSWPGVLAPVGVIVLLAVLVFFLMR